MKFQFTHQANTTQPIRMKLYVIHIPGVPTSNITGFINSMFLPNPFITGGTIRDYNSQPNPDYFRQYRILTSRKIYLPPDQYSGALSIKDIQIPMKYKNHHIRFNADSSTDVTSGQLIILIMSDSGNMGGTASTLGNIPVTGVSTGAIVNYNIIHYYYDN